MVGWNMHIDPAGLAQGQHGLNRRGGLGRCVPHLAVVANGS